MGKHSSNDLAVGFESQDIIMNAAIHSIRLSHVPALLSLGGIDTRPEEISEPKKSVKCNE
jgi:hypothetical protein